MSPLEHVAWEVGCAALPLAVLAVGALAIRWMTRPPKVLAPCLHRDAIAMWRIDSSGRRRLGGRCAACGARLDEHLMAEPEEKR